MYLIITKLCVLIVTAVVFVYIEQNEKQMKSFNIELMTDSFYSLLIRGTFFPKNCNSPTFYIARQHLKYASISSTKTDGFGPND